MSDHIHTDDCWLSSHECALKKIRDLQRTVAQLENGVLEPEWMKRVREGGMVETESEGGFTHKVVLQLHRPGPTWSGASDDPPTR